MAKFDFNNSRYAKFFGSKDNVNHLKKFINTEGIIGCNYKWYKTQGKKANTPCVVNLDGTALFTATCRSLEAAPLMEMRAPLADSLQEDHKGIEVYTASIPNFIGRGTVENAMERDYKVKLFEQFGDDSDIVAAYADTIQRKVDSVDATLTFMTAKLATTAKIDYRGIAAGIQAALHEAKVPLENFCNAGIKFQKSAGAVEDFTPKPWTDPDCNILRQMADIEAKFRDKWGTDAAFKWKFTRNMYYNVFLNNKFVKEFVANYRKLNYIATAEDIPTTDSMFKAASVDLQGCGISPIEIVEEKERNLTNNGDQMIKGWDDKIAVFCPAGDMMEIQWAEVADTAMFQKYGNNAIQKVFAKANDGLSVIVNTTLPNGLYKEWHTDIMMSAVPALTEFLYHVIVDTTKV